MCYGPGSTWGISNSYSQWKISSLMTINKKLTNELSLVGNKVLHIRQIKKKTIWMGNIEQSYVGSVAQTNLRQQVPPLDKKIILLRMKRRRPMSRSLAVSWKTLAFLLGESQASDPLGHRSKPPV
jgi:predicted secreted Zn-dependent protease